MSGEISLQSDSDWGEFLLTFELGQLVLLVGVVYVTRGERRFSGSGSGAPTTALVSECVC